MEMLIPLMMGVMLFGAAILEATSPSRDDGEPLPEKPKETAAKSADSPGEGDGKLH